MCDLQFENTHTLLISTRYRSKNAKTIEHSFKIKNNNITLSKKANGIEIRSNILPFLYYVFFFFFLAMLKIEVRFILKIFRTQTIIVIHRRRNSELVIFFYDILSMEI